MKALVLSSSPRCNGNSAILAHAVAAGLERAGHVAAFLTVDDVMHSFLKDCRTCRNADGECVIEDRFREVFMEQFLPADGFIAATPIYWYGMSAQLKAFFDRMFCYVAASYPQSASVVANMQGKRIGLVLSSEETFPTVSAGIIHQVQEYCRYTRSTFVGVVHGYGNSRGDVRTDPGQPIERAERFGAEFFMAHATDYQIDVPRPARVWS
jgi:multimeric flavodoxin WrbA